MLRSEEFDQIDLFHLITEINLLNQEKVELTLLLEKLFQSVFESLIITKCRKNKQFQTDESPVHL